jgi:2-hydroxy-3-oxopropionate reductase
MIKSIGFIGLGAMGTPMATHLLNSGYVVKGFDLKDNNKKALISLGLKWVESPKQAAEETDLVFLSLPNWNAVQAAVEGENGLYEGVVKGQIIVDTTTVPPVATQAMAQRMSKKEVDWMDIPVLSVPQQVKEKRTVFMAGGKKQAFEKIKPVLDKIGMRAVYVGKSGDGAKLKLVHNLILFLNEAAAIEGFTLGLKAGLNPELMHEVIQQGPAASDLIARRGKNMLAGDFSVKGSLIIGVKDVGLALECAKDLKVVLPIASLYHQYLLNANYRGWDDEDATVVMRLYEEMANLKR